MNLQPLEDRIVVRPSEAEETTVSGLVDTLASVPHHPSGELTSPRPHPTVGPTRDGGNR